MNKKVLDTWNDIILYLKSKVRVTMKHSMYQKAKKKSSTQSELYDKLGHPTRIDMAKI